MALIAFSTRPRDPHLPTHPPQPPSQPGSPSPGGKAGRRPSRQPVNVYLVGRLNRTAVLPGSKWGEASARIGHTQGDQPLRDRVTGSQQHGPSVLSPHRHIPGTQKQPAARSSSLASENPRPSAEPFRTADLT